MVASLRPLGPLPWQANGGKPPLARSLCSGDQQHGAAMSVVSKRTHLADISFAAVRDFYVSSRYAQQRADPETCDFTFGNPHEMPLDGIVAAIRERALPHD